MIPDGAHDGPLKRAQGYSAVSDDAPRLAQFLLTKKMESQINAIEKDFGLLAVGSDISLKAAASQIRSCIQSLEGAKALVDFLSIEGRASQIYWDLLVATPLPWRDWSLKRIPAHWAAISPRTSGRRERVRDATDPYNAAINFAYALAAVEMRVACEALSIDVDLGLIHVDERLRESCLYDLIESLRARADVGVLQLFHKETLHPALFHELRDGIVRLDPDLTSLLATTLMPRFRRAALELANDYAKQLRRITVPRRLVREAPKPIAARRETWEQSDCGYCKEPLPRKGLKFCGRHCYLRYSIEVAKPIEKAHQKLEQMRAMGISPGHGGDAARKRGQALAENNRRGITGRGGASLSGRRK
jgi:CRISPR/Cas system-associated endonuclease Cas1